MHGYQIITVGDKKILQREKAVYDEDSNVVNLPDLKNVDGLLKKVTYIAPYTFTDSDIEEVNIPDNILFIGHAAFFGCKSLKKVTIGNGYKSIPVGCFENCENLEEVNLSEGLTHVGTNAFLNCRKLKTINIPSTVKFIGHDTFRNTAIKELNIPNDAFFAGSLDFDVNFYLLKRERDEYVRTVTDNNSLIKKAINSNNVEVKTENKPDVNQKRDDIVLGG